MNLRQVLVQTVIGLIAILIAVLYAMFIVPQDWFIDSRESVVTISVIICATGYIITVWARYIRHLIRRRIDQRIIRDAESEMKTGLWQKPKTLRNEPTATIRLDRKYIRQSQRKSR